MDTNKEEILAVTLVLFSIIGGKCVLVYLFFYNFLCGSSGTDGHQRFSPSTTQANSMSRTYSGPNLESSLSLDRPMRISEVHVAAEHALENTITDPDLLKSLSSLEEFEVSLFLVFVKSETCSLKFQFVILK